MAFQKKDYLYSSTQGACIVDNIVQLSASKGQPQVPYYVLKSVFDFTKVAYIPVVDHQVKLRPLFTKEEATTLLSSEEYKKDENLKAAVDYVLREEG